MSGPSSIAASQSNASSGPTPPGTEEAPEQVFSVMEAVAHLTGEPCTSHPRCASPVLAEWFIAWNDALRGEQRKALRRYVPRLVGSRGTTDEEVARQWLIADWFIRCAAPMWLNAAGLSDHAAQLARQPAITDVRSLAATADHVAAAATAAAAAHEQAWSSVALLAQPDSTIEPSQRPPWRPAPGDTDPRRVDTWSALADATRSTVASACTFVRVAAQAIGYLSVAPPTWQATATGVGDAAGRVAWSAERALVTAPTWSWKTPPALVRQAGEEVARSALKPVQTTCWTSAVALVERMLAITERSGGTS
jgi:hypothetical protein